jgi:hypothetical protein
MLIGIGAIPTDRVMAAPREPQRETWTTLAWGVRS